MRNTTTHLFLKLFLITLLLSLNCTTAFAADGDVDLSFDAGQYRHNGYHHNVQRNGKILTVSGFQTLDVEKRNKLTRLNKDGSVDEAFEPEVDKDIAAIAIQPDGKIVVVGDVIYEIDNYTRHNIARLNSDGSLDTSFNRRRIWDVNRIAIQADGKILMIGGEYIRIDMQERKYIARLNTDGTLDTSFTSTLNTYPVDLVLQNDGKILLIGKFNNADGYLRDKIIRLNVNGSLDASFKSPVFEGSVTSLVQQADGKIVAGGNLFLEAPLGEPLSQYRPMFRLNKNGSHDPTFNPRIKYAASFASPAIFSMDRQEDDKILIGGSFNNIDGLTRNNIARLNPDGTLDLTFNSDVNSVVFSLSLHSNAKISILGLFDKVNNLSRDKIAVLLNTRITKNVTIIPALTLLLL